MAKKTPKRKRIAYGDKSGRIKNPTAMDKVDRMQSGRGKFDAQSTDSNNTRKK